MRYNNIDAWDCRIEFAFPHPHARQLAIHVWASDTGPTGIQRNQLRGLKARYSQLWPDIAAGILNVHPILRSHAELNDSFSEFVSVHLGEHTEDSVELVYTLDLPEEGYRSYFVPLDEWKVEDVKIAD